MSTATTTELQGYQASTGAVARLVSWSATDAAFGARHHAFATSMPKTPKVAIPANGIDHRPPEDPT